ncbi:MAG: PKD domain-containing protein [Bacteroidales bacterium]
MKTRKKNINLRELFRQKLEYAEVIPDAAIKSKLMRRVSRKEFLRFNPARLNIYYIGGILVTGITAAIILFSGSRNSDNLKPLNNPEKINRTDTSSYIEVQAVQPVRINPAISNVIHKESTKSIKVSPLPVNSESEVSKIAESHQTIISFPASLSSSFSKNGLFNEAMADKKKLQIGFEAEAFLIEPSDSAGCAPLKIRFYNKSTSYDSCTWTFGDGGSSNQKDPEWIFDVEGEYKVILEVTNHAGQHLISTASVTVHPRPKAYFEIAPEKAAISGDEIRLLNYSTNAVQFKWDFGDGYASEVFEPSHIYAKFGNYNIRLVVLSDWGCSDSVTVFNALSGSQYFINFPNAFIPNAQGPSGGYYSSKSDEAAQVFHPSYSGVSDYQLKIFSKLGIQIFESNDINLGWDGYNNGQLCEPGVYIWKVRVKFRNGEPFTKMGDVTLLKK